MDIEHFGGLREQPANYLTNVRFVGYSRARRKGAGPVPFIGSSLEPEAWHYLRRYLIRTYRMPCRFPTLKSGPTPRQAATLRGARIAVAHGCQ